MAVVPLPVPVPLQDRSSNVAAGGDGAGGERMLVVRGE